MGTPAKSDKFWPWVAAAMATLLSGVAVAAYTSTQSDIRGFDAELRKATERTSVLEQGHRDVGRRLQRIEEKIDQLLIKR